MSTASHHSFSSLSTASQTWLLSLIQEEYAALLGIPATASADCWARAVAAADPVFLLSSFDALELQLEEVSHQRLLAALRHEFCLAAVC